MVNKLSMENREDVRFVGLVAKSMFEDGATNWGRVASLVTFGAVVAQYMQERGRRECVEQVAQEISSYLLTDQRDWLVKNKAWVSSRRREGGTGECGITAGVLTLTSPLPPLLQDGFAEFFQVSDAESTVRHVLMAVAGVAGIGAGLALLIR